MATQKQVAEYFNVSDRTIRSWSKTPGFPKSKGAGGYDIRQVVLWRIEYLDSKCRARPDPAFEEPADDEKELKLAEMRGKIRKAEIDIQHKEFDLEVKQGRFAPIEVITRTLEQVSVAIANNLDSLLPRLKKARPDISQEELDEVKNIIAVSRNEVASIEPDLSSFNASDYAGGYEGAEPTQDADPSNSC
ncbi:terminase small subunit [Pseudoalteromonas ruthenica]|uniref:terminase small subunit n=1 Tax=Pseudoalteromonas ruthenica TaxID=151081 RepID=UPI00110BC767|nr:terminase small subunit [Pseudoalteromonas ruthenica]TMP23770.1 hypothetical protein CWC06_09455 [Pseudoalteromonas ruthenica]